ASPLVYLCLVVVAKLTNVQARIISTLNGAGRVFVANLSDARPTQGTALFHVRIVPVAGLQDFRIADLPGGPTGRGAIPKLIDPALIGITCLNDLGIRACVHAGLLNMSNIVVSLSGAGERDRGDAGEDEGTEGHVRSS